LLHDIEDMEQSLSLESEEENEEIEEENEEEYDEEDEEEYGYNERDLIGALLERQSGRVSDLCSEMLIVISKTKFSFPVAFEKNLREICDSYSRASNLEKAEKKDIFNMLKKLKDIEIYIQKWDEQASDFSATYVQNCRINCSGDITISGAGSYNSHYTTPMNIHIDGFFRGGSISAGGDVFINEAGSPAAPLKQDVISLGIGSTARFHKVYENVNLAFGSHTYRFALTREMVKVFYNTELDEVMVTSLSND